MFMKQLSIFVENQNGRLQQIIEALGNNGVNLRALSIAETAEFGILRLIVSDLKTAKTVLAEMGVVCKTTDVLAVSIEDCSGGLSAVLKVISENGIGIEYMYAFLGRVEGKAFMVLKADDEEKAQDVLLKNGFSLADPAQI